MWREGKGIYGGPVTGNSRSAVFSNSLALNKSVELSVTDFKCFGKWGRKLVGLEVLQVLSMLVERVSVFSENKQTKKASLLT